MFKYAIVEFDGKHPKEVEVVCGSWLIGNQCYWPMCNTRDELAKLLKDESLPGGKNWGLYSVSRVLSYADNYLDAKKKCTKAEFTSDVTSEDENSTRQRRKPQRLLSSESHISDEDILEEYSDSNLLDLFNPRECPKNFFAEPNCSNGNEDSQIAVKNLEDNSLTLNTEDSGYVPSSFNSRNKLSGSINKRPVSNSQNTLQSKKFKAQQHLSVSASNNTLKLKASHSSSVLASNKTMQSKEPQHSSPLSSFDNIQMKRRNFQNSIGDSVPQIANEVISQNAFKEISLKKQEALKQDVEECKLILKSLAAHCLPSGGEFPLANHFPLVSLQQIEDTEEWLKDDHNNLDSMISYLTLHRGVSAPETCRKILRHLFSKEIARCFNWVGRGEKIAFSSLFMKDIVIRAVLKIHSGAAIPLLEDTIKTWLKNQIKL